VLTLAHLQSSVLQTAFSAILPTGKVLGFWISKNVFDMYLYSWFVDYFECICGSISELNLPSFTLSLLACAASLP